MAANDPATAGSFAAGFRSHPVLELKLAQKAAE
jgi:hypothetical protein